MLDEFARLGPAPVLAHAFAWVAGYGLRLLAVLQSPSQLRAIYGPDVAEEVMTNCGVEIVFAPKELKVAQELSDRLGAYTTDGRSRSRPNWWKHWRPCTRCGRRSCWRPAVATRASTCCCALSARRVAVPS